LTEEKKLEPLQQRIEYLLRATNLSAKDIAKQLHIKIYDVYRHKAWPEVRDQRKKQTATKTTPLSPQAPSISYEHEETPQPPQAPPEAPSSEEPQIDIETETTETETSATQIPFDLKYGSLKGLIEPLLEVICDTIQVEKSRPSPVKIEKLDHAIVDFCKAFKWNFADPRLLATVVLAATCLEIGVPIAKEKMATKKAEVKTSETTTDKPLPTMPSPETKPNPITEKIMNGRVTKLLEST
jgi:hypothetical protein